MFFVIYFSHFLIKYIAVVFVCFLSLWCFYVFISFTFLVLSYHYHHYTLVIITCPLVIVTCVWTHYTHSLTHLCCSVQDVTVFKVFSESLQERKRFTEVHLERKQKKTALMRLLQVRHEGREKQEGEKKKNIEVLRIL